jgi:hypothetical protein
MADRNTFRNNNETRRTMKEILNGLRNGLHSLLGTKRKFSKIALDEIRKERIRLEQAELKLLDEVTSLEAEKKELFSKGAGEGSQRLQLVMARKIKELDSRAKGRDKQLAMVSRQLRVLSGMGMLKENEALTKEMGISSMIGSMDLTDLEKYIERSMVDGEFQMEKLGSVLETLEGADSLMVGADEDDDTMAIVAAMQEAAASQSAGEATGDAAIDAGLADVQNVLDKDKPEAGSELI